MEKIICKKKFCKKNIDKIYKLICNNQKLIDDNNININNLFVQNNNIYLKISNSSYFNYSFLVQNYGGIYINCSIINIKININFNIKLFKLTRKLVNNHFLKITHMTVVIANEINDNGEIFPMNILLIENEKYMKNIKILNKFISKYFKYSWKFLVKNINYFFS